jgi:predicted component of type VI protein secretion system
VVEQLVVRLQVVHQPGGVAVERHAAAERRLQAPLETREEGRLADLAALEREQRVHAVVREAVRHRLPVRVARHAGALLEAGERAQHRRGEDAAEVGDDRPDHARRSTS